jgi:hypothetical protein
LLETGLLLVLIPWSAFWDRNYFLEASAELGAVLTSNYTRGAITGLGLLNVWAALGELGDLFGSRKSEDPPSPIEPQSEIRDPQ